jgi:hypothetical protein
VRVATIIAISSWLRESSDSFDYAYVLDDPKITNSTLNLLKYESLKENFVQIGILITEVSQATIITIEGERVSVSRATKTRFGLAKGPHQVVMTL